MSNPSEHEFVSVLLATRNRPEDLRVCLTSLLASSYPAFEVIIIDQSEVPSAIPLDPRLRMVSSTTKGKSRALNLALSLASGKMLAFTDDDCTIDEAWLQKGVDLLRSRPEISLTFGALVPAPHDPLRTFIPSFLPDRFEVHKEIDSAQVRTGAGANMFARRELFDTIKGFDEVLGPGARFRGCEEFDLYYRTLLAGYSVAFDPDNPVVHWGGRSIQNGAAKRLLRDYGFGEAASLAKHSKAQGIKAIALSGRTFFGDAKSALAGLARLQSYGLLRMASWMCGFVLGLATPLDSTQLFFYAEPAAQETQLANAQKTCAVK